VRAVLFSGYELDPLSDVTRRMLSRDVTVTATKRGTRRVNALSYDCGCSHRRQSFANPRSNDRRQ
jgi:hypothetical protein